MQSVKRVSPPWNGTLDALRPGAIPLRSNQCLCGDGPCQQFLYKSYPLPLSFHYPEEPPNFPTVLLTVEHMGSRLPDYS